MPNLKSRKSWIAVLTTMLAGALMALGKSGGVEWMTEDLANNIAGTVTAMGVSLVLGVAHEDHGKHSANGKTEEPK